MVALNTSSWTMINYWSSSAGYADYVAQVSVWGKVRSQSIANNNSIVDFKYRKRIYSPTNAYYETAPALWNYNNFTHRIKFSNNAHSASATFAFGRVDYPANREWSDISISDTSDLWWGSVAHNDDGTCSISYTATGTRPSGTATYEESGTITLPTIARASKPSVSKQSMTLDGSDSVVISTNRKSSSFTHTLAISVGGNTVTINNVGASYEWVPGVAYWMPYMTNKSMTVTVSCTTYNGSTRIGSVQSTSFTLNVNTAIYHPAILSIEHSDINADTVALETDGTYIKGFSNLSLSTNVTVNSADYGSLVQSVTITHNGISRVYTNSLGVIEFEVAYSTIVSANTIIIKVTDNRGVEVSQTVNLTVIPYDVPRLSAIEIKRVNANDQESETGVYLRYKLSSTVFWGSFGQVNNALKVYSRYKLPSAQNYSGWFLEQTINTAGTDQYKSYEITGTCDGEYSSSTQFDVQLKVEDELGNAVLYAKVLEGIPVFAWGADHFDIYGTLHIHDREDVSQYVTLSSSDSLAMHNYSWSGSWSNSSSASRTIQISGKGIVLINCYVRNGGTDDTGQCDATIYLWNTSNANQGLLSASANRVSASSTHPISANASTQYYYDGSSANSRLRCNISCTKNGTNSWRIQATTIGCTLAVL